MDSSLVEKIIAPHKTLRDITPATSLLANNSANATTPLPDEGLTAKTPQKLLSRRIDESRLHLLENLDTGDRFPTVLQSVRQQGTGAFLNVVPSPTLGLYIPPCEFTLATKYRFGNPVYPNPEPCLLCQKSRRILSMLTELATPTIWSTPSMNGLSQRSCSLRGRNVISLTTIRDLVTSLLKSHGRSARGRQKSH